MKTKLLTKLGILALMCLMAFSARAYIVFQDNFNCANNGALETVDTNWFVGYGNTNAMQLQVVNNDSVVIPGTSLGDAPWAFFTNGPASAPLYSYGSNGVIYLTNASAYYFASNSTVPALYFSMTVSMPSIAGMQFPTYFAYVTSTNFSYRCRLYMNTNSTGSAYRIAVGNAGVSTTLTNVVQQDLSPGTTYTVVGRYLLNSGISTVWVNPNSETNTSPSVSTNSTSTVAVGVSTNASSLGSATCAVGLHNFSGVTNITIGNLIVGTEFADVVPGSINPPSIITQPQDNPSGLVGYNTSYSVLALGDTNLSYQWYYDTNTMLSDGSSTYGTIVGSQSNVLTINNMTLSANGTFDCVVTNTSGTNHTRYALLTVYSAAIAPAITNAPVGMTNNTGDTSTFTVLAGGVPPPNYQWYVITNNGAVFKTNAISAATATNLVLANCTTNQNGSYYVVVTNYGGAVTSSPVPLLIIPTQNILTNIINLLQMVNTTTWLPTNTTSIFTVQGTVTSWTNLTSSGSCEFYIQDGTAGIEVFWSGAAASTNLPPAGAYVKVTAPLNYFDGQFEIEPYFTNTMNPVKIISTGNPLPAAQPLPFDANWVGNPAAMQKMIGTYFVASNVSLDLSTGPSFTSGETDPITNNASVTLSAPLFGYTFTNTAGQEFTSYIYSYVGSIVGQPKPAGPVTIYGVMGIHTTSSDSNSGYQFIPTRYADIISYINITNVMSNARAGDLATNNYSELVVRPGETLTTYVSIADPTGGTVSLSPTGTLPTGASWANYVAGTVNTPATIVFNYTGNSADAGTQFNIQLDVTSTTGNNYTETFTVYVPTTQEQGMAITEFLVKPTTNTTLPWYNPLHRSPETTGISTNDQYVELANISPSSYTTHFTMDEGNANSPVFDSFDFGSPPPINSSSSLVVYGGNGSSSPGLSAPSAPSTGLGLSTAGGTLVLRDVNGYIIDRVVYGSNIATNGSMKRFPTINSRFVPQAYVGTNAVNPGYQYDGSAWGPTAQTPKGVTNVAIQVANGKAVFGFTAVPNQASTLWSAGSVYGPFSVINGQDFLTSTGAFTNPASSAVQFYFITTQTNGIP